MAIPLPIAPPGLFATSATALFALSLLFGGAARQGLWSDAVVEIACLPLLCWAIARLFSYPPAGPRIKWALVLLGCIVAIPILQLIPMSPRLWSTLPGRAEFLLAYKTAGLAEPWLPLSLDPQATVRSVFALLPAITLFLSMLTMDVEQRRGMIPVLLGVALVSIGLGLLQTSGSNFYFYDVTNEGMAVGFFANGNHNGTFLACSLAYCAATVLAGQSGGRRSSRIFVALMLIIVVGAGLVGSRAGLGLTLLVGIACAAMVLGGSPAGGSSTFRRRMVIALAIGTVLLALFGLFAWGKRNVQGQSLIEDLRWPVAVTTLKAAGAYMPFGTGLGTFVPIYNMYAPRTDIQERYVNHAHNDWLEIPLEAGVPGLLAVFGFLAWFVVSSGRAWRRNGPKDMDQAFARAGCLSVMVILVHSIVDYPLRSIAIMSIMALSCGFLLPAAADKN